MVRDRHKRTIKRLKWLINVRWGLVVILIIIPPLLNLFKSVTFEMVPFAILTVAIIVYNFFSWIFTRNLDQKHSVVIDSPEVVLFLNFQIIVDFFFISAVVFFSGGLFSPVIFFFMFDTLVSCILLSPREGYLYSGFGVLLVSIIGVLQYLHLVPALGIAPFIGVDLSNYPLFTVVVMVTLGIMLYLATYLVNHFFKMSTQEQQAFGELTNLFEIGKTISSSLDLEDTLGMVIDNAIKVTGTDAGSIALLEENSDELVIKAAKGFSKDFVHTHRWKVRPDGMTAKILSRTDPYILNNAAKDPSFNNPIAIKEGIKSLIAVPLFFGEKTIGILYVDDFEPRTFSESEVRLVSILATQAAIAINNAQMHEEAKWLAITDGLTQVYNHRFFQEQLSKEVRRAERYGHQLSVIMMDIDYFKDYNDKYGHKKGDEILRIIAKLLNQYTRKSDLVARYGGDEFVVIFPETGKKRALDLAERIRARIEGSDLAKGEEFVNQKLTISLGVASFPDDAETAGKLIDKVDEVLYLAKEAGRNKACFLDKNGKGLYCIPSKAK